MLAAGNTYPYTCNPDDVWKSIQIDREGYFFIDVQARGYYPRYALKQMEREGTMPIMEDGDQELLKDNTVDFISFSYYSSRCTSADPDMNKQTEGNVFATLKNPYLKASEWGWQIDPQGLSFLMKELYERYEKPLFIVENGIGIDEKLDNGKVYDDERIEYYQKHITSLKCAVEHDGVDLMGYLAWSPIDFLSSHKEMRKRYGFVYVNRGFEDLLDLARYKKKSFYWYKKVIATNGENLQNDIEY